MTITVVPITEAYIDGYNACLTSVALERRYMLSTRATGRPGFNPGARWTGRARIRHGKAALCSKGA